MPVAVGFSEPEVFLVHASGAVTYAECQRVFDDILAHPGMGDSTKILVDAHTVTAAPSSEELRTVARDMKRLFGKRLKALAIVTDQAFVYGVSRMFGVFAEAFGFRVRAFRTVEEAEAWVSSAE